MDAAPPLPDWRDADGYGALRRAEPAAFAWEWLRRDGRYRAAAGGAPRWRESPSPRVEKADPAAAPWGLHAFEDPGLAACAARPVWRRERYARVLVAGAEQAGSSPDRFDLARLARLATLVRAADGEHLLVSDGATSLRLDIVSGSLLDGPVMLSYRLAGFAALRGPLETLHALLRFRQAGGLAPGQLRDRNRRLILLLRATDALRTGATQREVAAGLLSAEAERARWRAEAPSLRLRAQRLVKGARAMAGGGYRVLLRA